MPTLSIPPPSVGNPIWMNHNLWIDMGPQTERLGEIHEGVAGVLATYVQIADGSATTAFANAEFYVVYPSPAPMSGLNVPSLPNGQSSDSAQPVKVTFSTRTRVAAKGSWTPIPEDTRLAGRHVCIIANVYGTIDNIADGRAIQGPLTSPLPLTDHHHAQRNITILTGGKSNAPHLVLVLPEPKLLPPTLADKALIRVQPVAAARALTPVVREQLLTNPNVMLLGGKPTPEADKAALGTLNEPRERIRLRGGGTLVLAQGEKEIHASSRSAPTVHLSADDGKGETTDMRTIVPLPGRSIPVTARFELLADDPGAVQELDLVLEGEDGAIAGGIRVVILHGLA
jgi:hypothetical protein